MGVYLVVEAKLLYLRGEGAAAPHEPLHDLISLLRADVRHELVIFLSEVDQDRATLPHGDAMIHEDGDLPVWVHGREEVAAV